MATAIVKGGRRRAAPARLLPGRSRSRGSGQEPGGAPVPGPHSGRTKSGTKLPNSGPLYGSGTHPPRSWPGWAGWRKGGRQERGEGASDGPWQTLLERKYHESCRELDHPVSLALQETSTGGTGESLAWPFFPGREPLFLSTSGTFLQESPFCSARPVFLVREPLGLKIKRSCSAKTGRSWS
jgi:hypothetical protein